MILATSAYVVSVYLFWWEYWLQKLHILYVYHIMPLITVHEIFSQYDMYFSICSYFTQILKGALLYTLLSLEA